MPRLISWVESTKLCVYTPRAYIQYSEIYNYLMRKTISIDAAIADTTDYESLAAEANDKGDEALTSQYIALLMIRRLAPTAKRNLDEVYDALFT